MESKVKEQVGVYITPWSLGLWEGSVIINQVRENKRQSQFGEMAECVSELSRILLFSHFLRFYLFLAALGLHCRTEAFPSYGLGASLGEHGS